MIKQMKSRTLTCSQKTGKYPQTFMQSIVYFSFLPFLCFHLICWSESLSTLVTTFRTDNTHAIFLKKLSEDVNTSFASLPLYQSSVSVLPARLKFLEIVNMVWKYIIVESKIAPKIFLVILRNFWLSLPWVFWI